MASVNFCLESYKGENDLSGEEICSFTREESILQVTSDWNKPIIFSDKFTKANELHHKRVADMVSEEKAVIEKIEDNSEELLNILGLEEEENSEITNLKSEDLTASTTTETTLNESTEVPKSDKHEQEKEPKTTEREKIEEEKETHIEYIQPEKEEEEKPEDKTKLPDNTTPVSSPIVEHRAHDDNKTENTTTPGETPTNEPNNPSQ